MIFVYRLIGVIWIFGFIVLALAASQLLKPTRSRTALVRIRMSLIWPIALMSPAGRARLRRG
jgi:hypothetical protein